MSTTVTSAATPIVRSVTVRYSDSVVISLRLSNVRLRLISPVKLSTVHSAETSSAASATTYTRTSQVSGAASSRASRVRGFELSDEETRRAAVPRGWGTAARAVSTDMCSST